MDIKRQDSDSPYSAGAQQFGHIRTAMVVAKEDTHVKVKGPSGVVKAPFRGIRSSILDDDDDAGCSSAHKAHGPASSWRFSKSKKLCNSSSWVLRLRKTLRL